MHMKAPNFSMASTKPDINYDKISINSLELLSVNKILPTSQLELFLVLHKHFLGLEKKRVKVLFNGLGQFVMENILCLICMQDLRHCFSLCRPPSWRITIIDYISQVPRTL